MQFIKFKEIKAEEKLALCLLIYLPFVIYSIVLCRSNFLSSIIFLWFKFNISCKVLLVESSLSSCFHLKITLFSPSFIKDAYAVQIILDWPFFFFFQGFKDGICFVLVCTISDEKSMITLTVDPLNSICLFLPSDCVSAFIFNFSSNITAKSQTKIFYINKAFQIFGFKVFHKIEIFSATHSLSIIPPQVLFSLWDFN